MKISFIRRCPCFTPVGQIAKIEISIDGSMRVWSVQSAVHPLCVYDEGVLHAMGQRDS